MERKWDSSALHSSDQWAPGAQVSPRKWVFRQKKERKVKSLSFVQLFVTPWTIAYQRPRSMGFSRQEHWSGLPFPSPGDIPDPGIEPQSSTLQADTSPSEPPGKPLAHECAQSSLLSRTTGDQGPAPEGLFRSAVRWARGGKTADDQTEACPTEHQEQRRAVVCRAPCLWHSCPNPQLRCASL